MARSKSRRLPSDIQSSSCGLTQNWLGGHGECSLARPSSPRGGRTHAASAIERRGFPISRVVGICWLVKLRRTRLAPSRRYVIRRRRCVQSASFSASPIWWSPATCFVDTLASTAFCLGGVQKGALRVLRAETRLTVYRPLQVLDRDASSLVDFLSKNGKFWKLPESIQIHPRSI